MYAKLFADIRQSTIWAEDSDTRIVWITLLTMADKDGLVRARAPGISIQARVPLKKVREALALFKAPDPDSRSKDHDGRRMEENEEGYLILNYAKYRDIRDEDSRREYMRKYMRNRRAKEKGANIVKKVSASKLQLANADVDADVDAVKGGAVKVTGQGEENQSDAATATPPPSDAERQQQTATAISPDLQFLVAQFQAKCGWVGNTRTVYDHLGAALKQFGEGKVSEAIAKKGRPGLKPWELLDEMRGLPAGGKAKRKSSSDAFMERFRADEAARKAKEKEALRDP